MLLHIYCHCPLLYLISNETFLKEKLCILLLLNDFLNVFEQGALPFHFVLHTANYVAFPT